uniref:Cell division protein FtsX n=1 Tax=Candidatus Kentrum sp. MB TaxID=2138164 RepID=A0A450XZ75_9GAMM|nr:MAG: cell division transport system permease protein [Candidatus Kentron sp. MB]VFK34556.1 MAG: cell division transport system permease protein [Candidatus Kentron sp. MB]VFK76876.1 MAG: cell division transport system permease protein [Candidatus Kentron sp. MB]
MNSRRVRGHGRFVRSKQKQSVPFAERVRAILSARRQPLRARVVTLQQILITWAIRHLQVVFSSIGQLIRTPVATLMTGTVIGIALALPAGLYVLLENAEEISRRWEGAAQISLFLKIDKTDNEARALAAELRKHPELARVEVITRSQALLEYRQLSGFDAVIDALDGENPLPAVLVLYPAPSYSSLIAIQRMLDQLEQRDEVESAQFDLQWLKRLYTMMEIVERGILGLAVLLGFGVLLIIGNTIRLGIWNRRDEIEIAKLFGASDAFIRRPFLYTGLWHGLLGGLIAWIFIALFLGFLSEPISELATLYHSSAPSILLGIDMLLTLLAAGAMLGLSGSWLAVGRHLDAIEPS